MLEHNCRFCMKLLILFVFKFVEQTLYYTFMMLREEDNWKKICYYYECENQRVLHGLTWIELIVIMKVNYEMLLIDKQ
jgi:predicted CDP-diglyceride synthetase/phosphatidate cytidylyltransferase